MGEKRLCAKERYEVWDGVTDGRKVFTKVEKVEVIMAALLEEFRWVDGVKVVALGLAMEKAVATLETADSTACESGNAMSTIAFSLTKEG